MSGEIMIAVVAQVLSTAALLLLYFQIRQHTRQTELTVDTVKQLTRQTEFTADTVKLSREGVELSAAAAELSFNLEVVVRLQEVLYEIADDEQSYAYVWGDVNPRPLANRRPQLSAHAVLDVLSMALAASDRLPGFQADYKDYTEYVLTNSPNVLAEALAHPEWWPEVLPYAQKVKLELHGSDEQSEKV